MSQSNSTFGRRGPGAPEEFPRRGIPVLVKQIAGIGLGAAIIFALAQGHTYFMKQAGRSLDGKFVEQASTGNAQGALAATANNDAMLQNVHRTCSRRADLASLTSEQLDATAGLMGVASLEAQLVRSAAYVACLAAEQRQRFCDKAQRSYLATAVREHLKLLRQAREEWQLQMGGPAGRFLARDRATVDLPSARLDPELVRRLRILASDGLITTGDFGGFAGFGVPNELVAALGNVQAKTGACR